MELRATTPTDIATLIEIAYTAPHQVQALAATVSHSLIPRILLTELWPAAVPAGMIVRDDTKKKMRASSIIASFINESLQDKRFIEIGSIDNYCIDEAARRGATATGYNLTSDLAVVDGGAPYDIIMMYDVLDHIVDDQVRHRLLTAVRRWLKPAGHAYIRCHPFTSRHGCHNYHTLNKAYAQLFLSDSDLARYEPQPTVRTITPLVTYKQWFKEAGLAVVNENLVRQPIEEFFSHLSDPLLRLMAGNPFVRDWSTLTAVLNIQFADFIIQAA